MKDVNVPAAQRLAVAIAQYSDALLDIALYPKVGDAFRAQLLNRDDWERALRTAFREATGATLVRGRGGHGFRARF